NPIIIKSKSLGCVSSALTGSLRSYADSSSIHHDSYPLIIFLQFACYLRWFSFLDSVFRSLKGSLFYVQKFRFFRSVIFF
ncbi:unnamed protein product, partial [Brassica oleracea]